ncbi:MAG TPA: hypothetical protein VIF15_21675 [Polyangiaceae bacterium]
MRRLAGVGAVVVMVLGGACSSSHTSSPGDDGGGGGDGGSVGTCDQTCLDSAAGFAVIDLVDALYNQSIAGKPSGVQNVNTPCPLGGTAVITGSDSVDTTHNLTSVNLQYAMTSCQVSANGTQLTVNGTIAEVGSFDTSNNTSLNYSSTGATLLGSYAGTAINDPACVLHLEYNTSLKPQVTGVVCGRSF